jgi:hypothetical protein
MVGAMAIRTARDRQVPRVTGETRSVLRGELDNVGLPTLLTILEMERRSGMLIVQRGRQFGRLWVRQGRVIRARVEGRRGTGAEPVYQMLAWADGQFELWQACVDGDDEVDACTTLLLMEAARRADERRGEGASPSVTDGAW